MKRAAIFSCAAVLLAAALPIHANAQANPKDGWVSWDVPAVAGAPDWCCLDFRSSGIVTRRVCDLDGQRTGYSAERGKTTDTMRIYAKFESGSIKKLRALGPSCEVSTREPIRADANMNEIKSIREIDALLTKSLTASAASDGNSDAPIRGKQRDQMVPDLFAALAAHRDPQAGAALLKLAKPPASVESRKQSVFWLVQVRGDAGLDAVLPLMPTDPEPKVRQEAAFAVAQSREPRAGVALIKLAESDPEDNVRAKAWFWLAQHKSPDTEAAIARALANEKSAKVRREAIFALSQLPGERSAKALTQVAKNQRLTREDRKEAIFWLGQSKSPEALAFIDSILN